MFKVTQLAGDSGGIQSQIFQTLRSVLFLPSPFPRLPRPGRSLHPDASPTLSIFSSLLRCPDSKMAPPLLLELGPSIVHSHAEAGRTLCPVEHTGSDSVGLSRSGPERHHNFCLGLLACLFWGKWRHTRRLLSPTESVPKRNQLAGHARATLEVGPQPRSNLRMTAGQQHPDCNPTRDPGHYPARLFLRARHWER